MAELFTLLPLVPLSSSSAHEAATAPHPQWQSVLEVLRDWQRGRSPYDEHRAHLALAEDSIEDLDLRNDYSDGAKTVGRALMCVNCRRLNASQGRCSGQPLEKCPLLNDDCHAR